MGLVALQRWPLIGRREMIDGFLDALASGEARGFLVAGEAGVGKTRLAEECLAAAEQSGAQVGRAFANATAATMPLGAIAPLLAGPDDPRRAPVPTEPVALFEHARAVFADRAGAQPFVLFVDDVNLLDATSAVLLAQLLAAGALFLVATMRTGAAVPDVVTSLWRDHRVERLDLEPLDRNGIDTLLHLVLGGPLQAGSGVRLWEACRGNALFLHELVLGALDAGTLVEHDGIWHLERLETGGARLREIVERRVGPIDGPARDALDRLALCEPLGLSELEANHGVSALEDLERAGLIVVTPDQRRQLVRLAHPLHAEVLRGMLQRTRARRILLDQASQLERHGARRRDDTLRIATWRLDADGHADPELLVRAARLARFAHDFAGADRLASAALESSPSAEAALLVGESRYELGRFDEAETVLAAVDADALPVDPPTALLLASTRAKNLFWGRLEPERALEVLREAEAVTTDAEQDELVTEAASILTFTNRPREALDLIGGVTGDEPRSVALRALALAPALTAVGRCLEAVEVAEQGFAVHSSLEHQLAIAHAGSHIVAQTFALTDAGRLAEAELLARAGYDIAAADGSLIAPIWFCLNLGRIQLAQGRLADARRWYLEGVAVARRSGFDGPRRLGLAGVAIAAASVGDAAVATAAVEEADGLRPFPFLLAEQETARAWAASSAGEPARAVEVLVAATAEAERVGASMAEARAWHELVRVGGPPQADAAAARLAALAEHCDSPLVTTWRDHAGGLARDDGDALRDLVERYEGFGALLDAAETATAANHAYRRRQDQRAANAMANRADALAADCDGARTPGLATVDSVVALSAREQEVATLAAAGVASKEIAARLFLSVRTVNNHLQRVYTKLGVRTRGELADALQRRPEPDGGAR